MTTYISRDELAGLLKDKSSVPHKDYIVVDVRDGDFVGGNIKGCLNLPSLQFSKNVDSLVRQTKQIPLVIFHCAFSQSRGPKAARMYRETRKMQMKEGETPAEVVVLRGGFSEFQDKYRNDPLLVENWKPMEWN